METIDLSFTQLSIIYALIIFPITIFIATGLSLVKASLIATVRMTVQLALVGLYLRILFERNNFWLSGLWLVAMLVVANVSILQSAGLKRRIFFIPTLAGITISTALVTGVFIFAAIRPQPLYDARYLVPISGMILGNCLRGNILALERFYSGIRKNEKEFSTYLFMGAELKEATRPYMRAALKAACSPHLATMATMGIVALPGMMTGQILGGSLPFVAIKYQLAIMVTIFSSMALAAFFNIRLSMAVAFDDYGNLRPNIIKQI